MKSSGFTLIETLVAITLLTVAVVTPMSLTTQSLSASYYARDQITAFHLAQEAIEAVRHVRDGNMLQSILTTPTDSFEGIPSGNEVSFFVDTRNGNMETCSSGVCPSLKTDGEFYGYGSGPEWTPTRFTRTVKADFVGANLDELRIAVTISWQSGSFKPRSFTISENLYRWFDDGFGI